MINKKALTYLELHIGKIEKQELLNKVIQMGLYNDDALMMYTKLIKKKRSLALRILLIGTACVIIGLIVSIIGTNSNSYEYFYYYGPIVIGFLMMCTGAVLFLKIKKVE